MKMHWRNGWSVKTKRGAVSYRIDEGPQRSSSQPNLFFSFWEVLKDNIRVKQVQLGKQTNTQHGEENVQMKAHAYVRRWVDQI